MIENINEIISGKTCIKCKGQRLYILGDGRFKCSDCGHRLSPRSLKNELAAIHYFCLEITANKTARDLGLDYKTVSKIFKQLRAEIAGFIDVDFQELHGEIECDESYFGGQRKGTRGRGSAGKTIVFGLLERKGKVFTTVVENVEAQTLLNEIIAHTEKGSVFFTDKFRSYKSLKFYGKHHKIDHSREYAKKRIHINGLEGFWSFAKERFQKYHGVSKENFSLYLKEMEFRYNYRKENLYHLLCKIHFGPNFP